MFRLIPFHRAAQFSRSVASIARRISLSLAQIWVSSRENTLNTQRMHES
jgi:hypothetical protein